MERLRNAVWHIGKGLTIQALVEEALAVICEKLEKKYNSGKPFPTRKHEQQEEMLEWIGRRFDPEEFDAAKATKAMKKGLPDWRKMVW